MRQSLLLALLAVAAATTLGGAPAERIKVLIVDGQNNHAWATTTPMLRRILAETGRFDVDVSTSPAAAPAAPRLARDATAAQKAAHAEALQRHATAVTEHKARSAAAWAAWRPDFARYAVVVSNYNGETWPEQVRDAFTKFVREGGGFVSFHAANNAFPEWPEYNAMIGLGGWGGRNEKSGPYLRLRGALWARDASPGPGGGHGPQHEFVVEVREPQHPVLRGLPPRWLHTKDELYHGLRGPAENVSVLASAYSPATKENEPMLMAIPYGRGRVFHTTLGHGVEAVNGLGFQVTFARGVEWAATGNVTLPPPPAGALVAERSAAREVK